jgi:hypothetical protein
MRRQLLLAGEKRIIGRSLMRDLVADRAAEHGIAGLQRVEDRALRRLARHLEVIVISAPHVGFRLIRSYSHA